MTRKQLDLLLVVASSLALIAIILALPSAKAVRIILGLPFILVFPGYTLIAALFPGKDDLDATWRIALSLALSIAVVPLIGLALNYSPWGIRLNAILAFVTLFIVLTAAVAVYRRRLLPADEAFRIPTDLPWEQWSQARMVRGFPALALVLSLAGMGVAAFFLATSPGGSETFTEFYVLGPGGKAEAYPSLVRVGDNAAVILGVVNREGQDTTYQVEVRIDGESTDSYENLVLTDGERWEQRVLLIPTHAGEKQKVEFLLSKDRGSQPYRSLHLWLDVEAPPAEATRQPEGRPSPNPTLAPATTAAVTIRPAHLVYVVQPATP